MKIIMWKRRRRSSMGCIECGRTDMRIMKLHCVKCYYKERYANDKTFREKRKEYNRKYVKKRIKEDPGWGARRQRDFRKKHPESFNKCMARFYLRKLPENIRKEIIEEVSKDVKK